MTDLFGSYRSQTTRALQQINSSKYPDTNKDFEKNIQRLNQFVDYLASYVQTMQKGVDQANEDPITKLRNTVTDMGILFAGGELLYGINLGDLQYFLPALGAMFGFDSTQPFPINLLYAAEHFFLGYIIPLDSWAPAVEDIIDAWAIAFGLPADFVSSIHDLLDAIQSVTTDFVTLFNTIGDLFTIFDVWGGTGPFGDIWHSITTLLGGASLSSLGALVDPVFSDAAPWIEDLATAINLLDNVLKAFSGGAVSSTGLVNLANLFTPYLNLLTTITNPIASWGSILGNVLTAGLIPNLDASKITSGTLLQSLIPALTSGWGKTISSSLLSGVLLQSLIPSLTSGWGGTILSSFLSGTILASIIPNLDASKLTTGTLLTALLPNIPNSLLTGLISAGTILTSLLPNIPNSLLTGLLSGGLILGSLIPTFDASKIITGTFGTVFVPWAAPIDTIVNATGITGSGKTTADLTTALTQFPYTNIPGLLGGINVGSTIQNQVDVAVQAINGSTVTNNSLSVFQSALNSLTNFLGYKPGGTPTSTSVAGVGTTNNAFITNMAAAKPTAMGVDRSTDAPYNIDVLFNGTSIPTVGIVQKASLVAFIPTPHGGQKQSIRWLGYPTGGTMANINAFYIVVWKYNPATGAKQTPVYASGNISGSIGTGSSPVWNSLNLPSGSYMNTSQNDLYSVEFSIIGTGTYNIGGLNCPNGVLPGTATVPMSFGAGRWYGPDTIAEAHALSTAQKSGINSFISINISLDNGGDGGVIIATTTTNSNTDMSNYSVSVGASKNATLIGSAQVGTTAANRVALWWCSNTPSSSIGTGAQPITLRRSNTGSWYGSINAASVWGAIAPCGMISARVGTGNTSVQLTGAAQQDWDQQWYVAAASLNSTLTTSGWTTDASKGGVLVSASNIANAFPLALGFSDMDLFSTISVTVSSGGSTIIAVPLAVVQDPINGLPAELGLPYNNVAPYTSNMSYDTLAPWVGLSGVAGATTYNPVLTPIYNSQVTANPNNLYAWANFHDVILCGDGSGGKGGQPGYFPAQGGWGGLTGTWGNSTLTRAQMGSSNLTWTIGTGGAAGAAGGGNGGAGAGSSCSIPGYGLLSVPGGAAQTASTGDQNFRAGQSMPSQSYNGVSYPGGAGGASAGAWGQQPGGGGAGGYPSGYGNSSGGQGGAGIGYLYSYQ